MESTPSVLADVISTMIDLKITYLNIRNSKILKEKTRNMNLPK